jgi:peptide/nickel transport system permease protein
VLLVTISLNFLLPRLMPGGPLANLAGEEVGTLTPEERERVRREAGLDKPLHEQYGIYLADLARGELGYSYQRQRPVAAVLVERDAGVAATSARSGSSSSSNHCPASGSR